MTNFDHPDTRRALLRRRGVVVVKAGNERQSEPVMQALDLELAALGYALSMPLRERLTSVPTAGLVPITRWLLDALAKDQGSDQDHTPLFRSFPNDIPVDTFGLWVDRFLVHYFQAEDQACLLCGKDGTTHVLAPCHHVVCSLCFDGSNYSACPICGRRPTEGTPFLVPTKPRGPAAEHVRFRVLHLGHDVGDEARNLFRQLCARTQALSPDDRDVLLVLLREFGPAALDWIPEDIPLRENVAQVFGTLYDHTEPGALMERAAPHMTTATDVLRFIAAYSGADPSLQPVERSRVVAVTVVPQGILARMVRRLGGTLPPQLAQVSVPQKVTRFGVRKLPRPLRRALLALLERIPEQQLREDMLRHASLWVWVGQFLHPHEHQRRFPNVARAFHVVRKKSPTGVPAPRQPTHRGRVEAAVRDRDTTALTTLLSARPGELGRRLDHLLRLAVEASPARLEEALDAAEDAAPSLPTPMLLTLAAHFRTRHQPAPVRVYFPKGAAVTGVSAQDARPPLPPSVTARVVRCVEAELLARFARAEARDTWLLDEALARVVVPFNERTASRSAVALARGSSIGVPPGKAIRLFLHWCDPPGKEWTDLDLSVGFYDADWKYAGVCSYYQLTFEKIAKSAGDLTSAPYPSGATEFVDVDRSAAQARGIRYAVMVVNAYSGLAFGALDRAWAGLMLRDDVQGQYFDPRMAELKFALAGVNGIYLPLLFDLQSNTLHWLDLYSRGMFGFNNVGTSNSAIQKICPEALAYFASGARPNLLDLGRLHAAARGQRVLLRDGGGVRELERSSGESAEAFLHRLRSGVGAEPLAGPVDLAARPSVAALLLRGDLALPRGADVLAVFREQLAPTLRASDLLT